MNETLLAKAREIKALVFDVDGVLTDGKIIYDNQRNELKHFNVKDGFIIVAMQRMGFITGAITGRASPVVVHRCEELQLSFHYHGKHHKLAPYQEMKAKFGLQDSQIAYMGDDLPDLPILTRCGLSACPADAVAAVTQRVSFVSSRKGGQGAVRELAELILHTQGRLQELVAEYLA